jgi:hypothetical protein
VQHLICCLVLYPNLGVCWALLDPALFLPVDCVVFHQVLLCLALLYQCAGCLFLYLCVGCPAGSAEYVEAQARAMQQLAHKTYEEARFKAPRELVAGMGTDEDDVLDAAASAVKADAEEAAAAAATAAKPSKKRKKVAGGVSEEAAVAAAAVAAAEAAAANATVARQAAALANKRRKTGSGKASKAESAAAALADGSEQQQQQQQGEVAVKQEDGAVAASPAKQKSGRGRSAAAAAAQQQQEEGERDYHLVVCRGVIIWLSAEGLSSGRLQRWQMAWHESWCALQYATCLRKAHQVLCSHHNWHVDASKLQPPGGSADVHVLL